MKLSVLAIVSSLAFSTEASQDHQGPFPRGGSPKEKGMASCPAFHTHNAFSPFPTLQKHRPALYPSSCLRSLFFFTMAEDQPIKLSQLQAAMDVSPAVRAALKATDEMTWDSSQHPSNEKPRRENKEQEEQGKKVRKDGKKTKKKKKEKKERQGEKRARFPVSLL